AEDAGAQRGTGEPGRRCGGRPGGRCRHPRLRPVPARISIALPQFAGIRRLPELLDNLPPPPLSCPHPSPPPPFSITPRPRAPHSAGRAGARTLSPVGPSPGPSLADRADRVGLGRVLVGPEPDHAREPEG